VGQGVRQKEYRLSVVFHTILDLIVEHHRTDGVFPHKHVSNCIRHGGPAKARFYLHEDLLTVSFQNVVFEAYFITKS